MKTLIEYIFITLVFIFMGSVMVYASSYSQRAEEYSRHGCMVTTGTPDCQTAKESR